MAFLAETARLLSQAGWAIGNPPRMSGRQAGAEQVLSASVGVPASVSANSADGLGFAGRGERVAAITTTLPAAQS